MERVFLWAGIALCVVSLWAVARRDWVRVTRPSRAVRAEVVGHLKNESDGAETWAARMRFSAEGAEHEVVDEVYSARRQPPVGAAVTLRYPLGHPPLARLPRPWTWGFVYAALLGLLAVLAGRLAGWIGG